MAEENILGVINQVNTEAVPRATETAARFDESLTEVVTKLESFKRNSISTLDGYRTELTAKLTTADMQLDDSQRKLEVLMKRLSANLEQSSSEVEAFTGKHEELAADFLSESESIDKQVDAHEADLEGFLGKVEGLSNDVSESIGSYKQTTTESQSILSDNFAEYLDAHSNAMDDITSTLDDGTSTLLDKMATLQNNIESKLGGYESVYKETIGLLSDQTGDNADMFGGVLDIAGGTTESVAAIFDGSIGDIADKLEQISGLIETIEPVLEFIDGLT